jgi:hypothetical protein
MRKVKKNVIVSCIAKTEMRTLPSGHGTHADVVMIWGPRESNNNTAYSNANNNSLT